MESPFYRLFKSTYSLDRYPLAFGYLAGMIRKHTDWELMVYNADFHGQTEPMRVGYLAGRGFRDYLAALENPTGPVWNEVRATVAEFAPDVVGISTKSQAITSALITARIVKELNRDTLVVIGGPHPTMSGADVLQCPDVDACCAGEGEHAIVDLLRSIEAGTPFDGVKSVIYRSGDKIVQNPPREFIQDLDSLPFPHADAAEVLKDHHKHPITAFKNIMATRGCPYNCAFCASRKIWSRKTRFRSVESVTAEIRSLQEMGLKFIRFEDDTFGVRPSYIMELCEAIRSRCPDVRWSCELHVNLVTDEIISAMKAAGCHLIQIGIESGNNEILRQIRKQITIEDALRACRVIKTHGIELHVFFIIGFPQDTEETLADTVSAIRQSPADTVVLSIFTPFPGTDIFESCREMGLIGDDYDISRHNFQSFDNCFCKDIPPQRFREIAAQISKMVDKRNVRKRFRRLFSAKTIRRARELGLRQAARKALRVFVGR